MVDREDLCRYLDELLNCGIYDDFTVNGLQIEGRREIRRIVTGVSPSERLFRAAADIKTDAVLLHHGLFWKRGTPHPFILKGILKRRVAEIIRQDINLFAYHLPLDGDARFGNNVLIARAIGLQNVRIFPESGTDFPLIAIGNMPQPTSPDLFGELLDAVLETKGALLKLAGGEITSVAIVTGAGSDCWQDAANQGAQILLTGEIHESNVREAEEAGINLYAGGHYNTEKWGVRALGEHLAGKFDLDVQFIDIPNPI